MNGEKVQEITQPHQFITFLIFLDQGGGSFEANPPFVEEIMITLAQQVIKLVSEIKGIFGFQAFSVVPNLVPFLLRLQKCLFHLLYSYQGGTTPQHMIY